MTVPEPRAAASAVVALVEGEGGRIDARQEQAATTGATAHAHLTARVPAADVTTTLTGLAGIGTVDQVNLAADDVTGTAEDLDARIKALQLSVARMEDLLSHATTTADLITAEGALTERQGNLETLQSQRARLAEQVALSTLEIDLSQVGTARVAASPHGFLGGLAAGWRALVATVGGLVLVLGVLAPWLAVATRRPRRRAATARPRPPRPRPPARACVPRPRTSRAAAGGR
jgi:hypothetical protein